MDYAITFAINKALVQALRRWLEELPDTVALSAFEFNDRDAPAPGVWVARIALRAADGLHHGFRIDFDPREIMANRDHLTELVETRWEMATLDFDDEWRRRQGL